MKDRRHVAGLWCDDVLARLSDYLDGDLSPADRAQVEEHLRGCAGCTQFGGEMSRTIEALRRHLGGDEAGLPDAVRDRLRAVLHGE